MRLGLWGRLLLAATLGSGSAAAAPHIIDIRWDASGRFAHQVEVPAGKFIEVCGALKTGQRIAWTFESSQALAFNIHYHRGKETVYPVKLAAAEQAADSLAVQVDEPYCWMWSNKSAAAASLRLELLTRP